MLMLWVLEWDIAADAAASVEDVDGIGGVEGKDVPKIGADEMNEMDETGNGALESLSSLSLRVGDAGGIFQGRWTRKNQTVVVFHNDVDVDVVRRRCGVVDAVDAGDDVIEMCGGASIRARTSHVGCLHLHLLLHSTSCDPSSRPKVKSDERRKHFVVCCVGSGRRRGRRRGGGWQQRTSRPSSRFVRPGVSGIGRSKGCRRREGKRDPKRDL